ncbi:hypothetical protein [Sunxiuqinia elliptica]|uniref:hypothetical protein n=1 Tax=Sunxiuqinia elliptica TaxID=655355 RepID=UPI001414E7B6|nr:hypothetical protein [Sunxiuqinia elliptica]
MRTSKEQLVEALAGVLIVWWNFTPWVAPTAMLVESCSGFTLLLGILIVAM